ncbi:MAG: hypothetical protein E7813_17405 [Bradyrhizobium sp.]|uniref:glycosyltransferase family 2 protein n=1 Tax=Bradyrhizobium sp. TaxID=376 RepID=UPI001200A11B|nr:hypothetical protein [Bradyrhizobium sp.]THD64009.1 MAG: hypothetical protein E7813_17405 [Bradyrhizobium sp.]
MNLPVSPRTEAASMLLQKQPVPGTTSQAPTIPGLSVAIGIVLFNNGADELTDLARTLQRAIARLAENEANANPQGATAVSIRLQNNGDSPIDPAIFGSHARLGRSTGNLGFGKAHNLLMREAFADGAEFYLALNPDGKLHPDALIEMIAVARRNEGRALIEAAQFPEEPPKSFDALTFDTPWASGCCLLVPARIFDSIGGFDENIFLYFEDVDLSWRALAAGYSVKHAPRALIHHSWHRARPGTNHATRQVYLDAARYLAKKWGNEAFVRKIESDLAARGWEPKPFPKLIPSETDLSVADFSHGLRFASERWICPTPIPNHGVTRQAEVDNTIDIVVRFHDPAQIVRLSRCLFSLYGQRHQPIQILLMLHGLVDADVAAVDRCVDAFDWSPPRRRPIVTNVAVPPTGDHRSLLWNAGVDLGRSRYIGFCDFDDVVYPTGYGYLLHRIQFTGAAGVFASSLHVDCTPMHGFDFAFAKRFIPGKDRYDFFLKNFCPPNSLLLDRTQIQTRDLYADTTLSKHEDYRVFAVIVSKYQTDWASIGTAVAEYIHRSDGSNTVMAHRSDAASWRDWGETSVATRLFFNTLTTTISVNDIVRMRDAERRVEVAEAKTALMQKSLSWRLTSPLRSRTLWRIQQRWRRWFKF